METLTFFKKLVSLLFARFLIRIVPILPDVNLSCRAETITSEKVYFFSKRID